MPAIFRPEANVGAKLVLLALGSGIVLGLAWWFTWQRTDWERRTDFTLEQPVPFSHQHHVAGLGIDCRFCHTYVEVSSNAGMPPTYTCMTCHSQIWTNAAILSPIRKSLADDVPIVWNRTNNLPGYVYFDHSIHIAKGVGCDECHGQVDRMPLTYKVRSFTMHFCLDCHRNPGPRLRPPSQIYNTEYTHIQDPKAAAALLKFYHVPSRDLTQCSICHR